MTQKKKQDNAQQLITASQLARKYGLKTVEVKKALQGANVQPAKVRCGCAYYSLEESESVVKALSK